VMILIITGIGFLIHLYSVGYMEDDPDLARYFAYTNLFTGSMLILVLADSLPVLFIGWEGVGLCSYLLIGFWYTDMANAEAGQSWTHCHMAAQKGLVAGFWPWMRQGWIFLDDPTDAGSPLVLSGLVGLRAGLMRSRFATLEKDAALTLAHICGLQARKINGTKDVQYDGR